MAERQALAKTLAGDEARQVKQLSKPTVLAWAVNQVYWRTRVVYDRLIKSGKKLRSAQVAALNGRGSDIREVADEHRAAVTQAVAEASRLASEKGARPRYGRALANVRGVVARSLARRVSGTSDQGTATRGVRGLGGHCRQSHRARARVADGDGRSRRACCAIDGARRRSASARAGSRTPQGGGDEESRQGRRTCAASRGSRAD